MRILFFATYPTQPTGYGRIGNILSNYLASVGHEVHYVGISNFKNSAIGRFIHPAITLIDALEARKEGSTEMYGVDIMTETIANVKPDIVFIYNDIIVINRILNEFINTKLDKTFKLYLYLDLVYEYERWNLFTNIISWVDRIFVFSECWSRNLIKMGVKEEQLRILPHGIDTTFFYPTDTLAAKQVYGFQPDDFVVLNTNRNAYRKALDITIEAFAKFLKRADYHPCIKMFLNLVTTTSQGYSINDIIKIICIKNEIDYDKLVEQHIFIRGTETYLSDVKLNELYNACDVGINTCLGEGFGLCNLEHSCVGKPQIVSRVGALNDIFTNAYATLIDPVAELYIPQYLDDHQGYIQVCDSEDFVLALERYYQQRELGQQHGALAKEFLTKKYEWATILEAFNAML
jgi:glycosyltransferase involved in cell wall biosynthesis